MKFSLVVRSGDTLDALPCKDQRDGVKDHSRPSRAHHPFTSHGQTAEPTRGAEYTDHCETKKNRFRTSAYSATDNEPDVHVPQKFRVDIARLIMWCDVREIRRGEDERIL